MTGLRPASITVGLLLLLATPGTAAIWPERFGGFARTAAKAADPADGKALWEEYGLEEAERADLLQPGGRKTAAVAYRFKDSTGAFAAFAWQRPPDARPSQLGKLAVETPGGILVAFGNYLFRFEGQAPTTAELEQLFGTLPRLEQSPLPAISGSLPAQDLVPNSERYISGPAALEKFQPHIPPALAGFRFGTEAQLARYTSPSGEITLAVFSYPTPHIAREQELAFQKLPGAMSKRSGPLIAVIVSPSDPNVAEKLLSKVRYQAEITWSEHVPSRRDNIGNLILNIFMLVGILLGFSLVAGLAFGGLRVAARRLFGWKSAEESMITLDIGSTK